MVIDRAIGYEQPDKYVSEPAGIVAKSGGGKRQRSPHLHAAQAIPQQSQSLAAGGKGESAHEGDRIRADQVVMNMRGLTSLLHTPDDDGLSAHPI